MSFQIAFAWSPECEAELKSKGFRKREVYIKYFEFDCSVWHGKS